MPCHLSIIFIYQGASGSWGKRTYNHYTTTTFDFLKNSFVQNLKDFAFFDIFHLKFVGQFLVNSKKISKNIVAKRRPVATRKATVNVVLAIFGLNHFKVGEIGKNGIPRAPKHEVKTSSKFKKQYLTRIV